MANTLSGTPYVESSDLVANYPAVSEDLAERVDLVGILPFADSTARGTALPTPTDGQYSYLQDTNSTEYWNGSAWVAAGVAPGIRLVNTISFTSQTSISINDVFTSDYSVYQVVVDFGSTSLLGAALQMRFRTAGTDNSTSNYFGNNVYGLYTGGSPLTQGSVNGGTILTVGYTGSANESAFIALWISRPQLATQTYWSSFNPAAGSTQFGGGRFGATTQFDGFTLSSAASMTGAIRVYGYKNS